MAGEASERLGYTLLWLAQRRWLPGGLRWRVFGWSLWFAPGQTPETPPTPEQRRAAYDWWMADGRRWHIL
jgi:hypothetical protein